jgi:S1-C subfamily serine protease
MKLNGKFNNKILYLLVAFAFIGGLLGSAMSPQSASAGFFGDIYNQYLKPIFDMDGLNGANNTSSTEVSAGQEADNVREEEKQEEKKPVVPLYGPTIDYEQAVIKAVESASPAVISIIISKDLPKIEQCPYNPFGNLPPDLQDLFGQGFQFYQPCQVGTERQEVGGGSGFIVSSDGLIVTNKHVVADIDAFYTVLTNDGKKYDAVVLTRDPSQDLAIIKISASGLPVLKLGNSDSIKLGQTAIAIGNALGEFRNTVSVGTVSGLFRDIVASDGRTGKSEKIEGLIQTDAAINSGNSGGPLLNLKGEVIGINTATVSGAENIGFAIPINKAKEAVKTALDGTAQNL